MSVIAGINPSNEVAELQTDATGQLKVVDAQLSGGGTSLGIGDLMEILINNAQQTTASLTIADGAMDGTIIYNTQKRPKYSVMIQELLNTPSNTGRAIVEWSGDYVNYTGATTGTTFTELFDADGTTSRGFWCMMDGENLANYMKVRVWNNDGGGDSHDYKVYVYLRH